MTNNNLLMYGAIAVGAIYLYNRYTKKENPLGEEPQGGGGGGGGGGGFFPPMPPTPPIAPIVNPNQGRSYTAEQVTRGVVSQPVTIEMLKNQQASNAGVPTNTGITGIGMGTGTSGTGTSMTTTQGGNVFKPFDGYNFNGGLSLDQIRRSWNRP
jgi:hypothetical protein